MLIVSGSPDAINTNAYLRTYLADGFRSARPDFEVRAVCFEAGAAVARDWKPSLAVVFGSILPDLCDFGPLAETSVRNRCPLVFWLHDDPYEFDANYRMFDIADAIFTNDKSALIHYPPNLKVFHLPMAACEFAHRRTPNERSLPHWFFCGYAFDNRKRFVEKAIELLPHATATVVGPGWKTLPLPQTTDINIPNVILPDYYMNAWAVLSIGRDLDLANQIRMIKASSPGPRIFEAAMASAAQVCVADGVEITDYFNPGSEILLADDPQEFAEIVTGLMRNQAMSLSIGNAARERARSEHTYRHRALTILSTLGID